MAAPGLGGGVRKKGEKLLFYRLATVEKHGDGKSHEVAGGFLFSEGARLPEGKRLPWGARGKRAERSAKRAQRSKAKRRTPGPKDTRPPIARAYSPRSNRRVTKGSGVKASPSERLLATRPEGEARGKAERTATAAVDRKGEQRSWRPSAHHIRAALPPERLMLAPRGP